ncbi:hypothetical protein J2744_002303 [Halorubrum trapanicum]|uniref:DUF4864 domain-containing protein n=1 Tax=Halorubrum trapanicum TaxID=29284 RepID=A0A8J7UPA4_9EURY|nr:hypothetical protein [Halorubrum trapanicum]MBP1902610.1 hypothetical protein [Halorubrum trapanicum]
MTASNPIPPDAFAAAVESLDGEAFATLVGEAYATTADAVDVDPPRVTVSAGGRRTEILAVSAADETVRDESVDAVAVASDSPLDRGTPTSDVEVVSPADLRERLLYAVAPAEANAIAERILGVPVRSAAYDEVGGDSARDDGATESEANDDARDSEASDDARDADATDGESAVATPRPDRGSPERPRPAESRSTEASNDRTYPRTLLAAVAVVALLGAGVSGALVADTVGIDGPDGAAGVEGDGATDSQPTEPDPAGSADAIDGEQTAGPTDEAARNTALSPTCERSALQVVQIQMNALRYNDDATNDGIRTLRAFASPENREVVGSIGQYVALFETPRYAPMLTYDTAEYSVPEIADGTAEIGVVTRENGSVTGRYEFRLELIAGGSQGTNDALGDVDGCWMTDAVGASTE